MLKTRIIPTLLYKDFGLVKGVSFDSRRAVGSPMQAIKVYELRGVDELVLLDVNATQQARGPDLELIDELADECFMPLTVGGGIRDEADIADLLRVGADKVCVGTAAVEDPDVVSRGATRFGSQCIVVSLDVTIDAEGTSRVAVRSGTKVTTLDPVAVALEAEERGAGELLVQSVDRDGTHTGYDLDTIARVADAVRIPVIASGGAGTYDHLREGIQIGHASAVAAASMFHFSEQTPAGAKAYLREHGMAMRR